MLRDNALTQMQCDVKSKTTIFIILILLIILLFHSLNNYYILAKSRYVLGPDSISYFSRTIQIFQAFKNARLNLKSFYEIYLLIFGTVHKKPPLFFLTASPFLLFGFDKNIITMSNLIYFSILLFSTYGIGKVFFNSRVVGLFSAFLVSMFPIVFAFSRVLITDFALAGIVTLTFYLFVLNKFHSFKFSLLIGVIIGLGSLIKQTYFIFLLPILFYFFSREDNLKNKKALRNFLFSVILGLFIVANFYLPHFSNNVKLFYYDTRIVKYNPYPLYYLYTIFRRQLLPIFSTIFLISLALLFKKKKFFLIIMIFLPLIIFSVFSNKTDRYIIPIFPYIAIIISGSIWSLFKFRKLFFIILLLFSILQYVTISYPNIFPPRFLQKFLFGLQQNFIEGYGLLSIIDEGDWESPGEEIIDSINEIIQRKIKIDRSIKVLFIGQTWQIYTTIDYLGLTKGLPIQFSATQLDVDFLCNLYVTMANKDFNNEISRSDLIVIEETSPEDMNMHYNYLFNAFKGNFDKFDFIKAVIFPTNLKCYVYKNRKEYL